MPVYPGALPHSRKCVTSSRMLQPFGPSGSKLVVLVSVSILTKDTYASRGAPTRLVGSRIGARAAQPTDRGAGPRGRHRWLDLPPVAPPAGGLRPALRVHGGSCPLPDRLRLPPW